MPFRSIGGGVLTTSACANEGCICGRGVIGAGSARTAGNEMVGDIG